MLGVFVCWIPTFGWLGAFTGLLGIVFGVPSITHWYHKPGYAPWGISGLFIGVTAMDLSLAYQLKYLNATDLAPTISWPAAGAVFLIGTALTGLCLYLARTKNRPVGILGASLALASLIIIGTSALVTADKHYKAETETQSSSR
jgi:hypothetical protein